VSTATSSINRRHFLGGAGAGVAAAAVSSVVPTPAAHASPSSGESSGPTTVITVTGAVLGIPFITGTSQLDVAEYARRAAINTTALNDAWTRALAALRVVPAPTTSPASGNSVNWLENASVVIRVPAGFYAIDSWDMSVRASDLHLPGSERDAGVQYGEWSVRITVEADGVVLVAKDHPSVASAGTPVVYLGSPDSPGHGYDLLKRVTIRGLSIQSDGHPIQGFYVANRSGLTVEHAQEVRLERLSIFGLADEGLRLVGVMDSTIEATFIGWCARASRTGSTAYALSLLSHRDASGGLLDNCNAIRIIDTHVEFCDHELLLDRGTRHVEIIGSKFEHGWGTTSVTSPISIGYPPNVASSADRVREISFTSCMFVQNTYHSPAGGHPSHVVVGELAYGGGEAEFAKTAVTFAACHFSTPDGVGERWFTGGDTTFIGCDFGGCGTASEDPACFDLANDVTLDDCRFSVVRRIHDGLTGNTANGAAGSEITGSRADLFRFRGGASRVLNPVIYFPPPADGQAGAPGALATIGRSVGDANRIAGWHPANYGLPGLSGNIAMIGYEDTGRRHLGSSLVVEALTGSSSPVLSPDPNGRVSVCGWEQVRLEGGRTYRSFADGYAGQVVRVVANDSAITFEPGELVLKSGATTVAGTSDMTSFVFYAFGSAAAWFQI